MTSSAPQVSVIIPARNEEALIARCLDSIDHAAASYRGQVEVLVVLNRCTDATEEIARQYGARTIHEDARNLAKIRNTGVRAATGSVVVTIDADSAMSPNTLAALDRALATGKTIGGGTRIVPDRWSLGIRVTLCLFEAWLLVSGFSGGLFWCHRADFEAIGGFNERLISGEDVDFARRLKAHGKNTGRPFSTLRGAHITTSCRKFDAFGDWCVVKNPRRFLHLFRGNDRAAADAFYYDIQR